MAVVMLSQEVERLSGALLLLLGREAAIGAGRGLLLREDDRRRVRLVASGSGGASKRLTDGAEEGSRWRGYRQRWWWSWWCCRRAHARSERAEEERGVRAEERRRWCLLTLAAGNGVAVWDEARVGWAGMDETALRRRATGMRRGRAGCSRLLPPRLASVAAAAR